MTFINAARLLVGGVGESGRSLLPSLTGEGSAPGFFRGIVEEIFFDPQILTETEINQIKSSVTNPEFVDLMPPMSLLVRISNNSQDLIDSTPSIVYPFFSSHISLPIQAGEVVFIIYEDYKYLGSSLGRWISRPHENYAVEDPNFTHSDRAFDVKNTPAGLEQVRQNRQNQSTRIDTTPAFPNGADIQNRYSIQPKSNNENPFKTIRDDSKATKLQKFEPVPRFKKRPKDFVLQGSNNTLIVLGTDRISEAKSTDQNQTISNSGTVDIVTGRGRVPNAVDATRTTDQTKTSPFIVKNKFNDFETDKTTFQRNREVNKNEGNLDYTTDAARIYLTMNSKVDLNFKLDPSVANGIQYPDNSLTFSQPSLENEKYGNSYFLTKADHLRLIARKSNDLNINGSILLLKEGTRDEDLSFVYMNKEGKIQIEGNKLYLGKSIQENEPYIKWSIYDKHISELKTQINALADQVNKMAVAYDAAFKTSIAVPFSPISSLVAIGTTNASATATVASTTEIKTKINAINTTEAKSNKIFGE